MVPDGVRFIRVDRDEPDGLAPLAGEAFDAVVDVSRHPGQVRRAVAALKPSVAHWTLVSTVSVCDDVSTVGQRADTAPIRAPTAPEIEHSTEETYGAARVACEQAVGKNALICRAGLIAGPEDPTGRFTYWPARLARGGEVLVAGTPDDAVQLIDVRDLARWIVHAARTGLTGCFDGIGPICTRGRFLAECAEGVGASCTITWVDRAFLERQNIKRWAVHGRCRCGSRCRIMRASTRATRHRRARLA
jgi:nucleoside-diphosphate-sugar epimerase